MNTESDLECVADPFLNGAYNCKEMLQMVTVAAACIRHSAAKRPSMGQVRFTINMLLTWYTDTYLYFDA